MNAHRFLVPALRSVTAATLTASDSTALAALLLIGKLHCFAGDTTSGDTNGEEISASGATVVRRKRIWQQGRTRLIGDR
ncbi:hypothetical protein [Streptomyces sp. NPDC001275]